MADDKETTSVAQFLKISMQISSFKIRGNYKIGVTFMHISLISYFIENKGSNDSDGAVSTILFNQNSAPVLILFEI